MFSSLFQRAKAHFTKRPRPVARASQVNARAAQVPRRSSVFISAAVARDETRRAELEAEAAPLPFVERSEEQWAARLRASLEYWQEGANELTSSPDAALLIRELNAPSQFVIRQLPAAARDAIALCEDASISRGLLAERLGQDPSLVQAMLRVANSAAMNTSGAPVLSLAQALERLGVQNGSVHPLRQLR